MALSSQRSAADPAVSAALLLIRVGLVVLAFAVPVSTVVWRRAIFTLLPVGLGLVIVAVTLLPRPPFLDRTKAALRTPMIAGGMVLLAWSALSILWTPYPSDAIERIFKECGTVLLLVAAIVLLPERTRTSDLYLVPLGLACAAAATAASAIWGTGTLGAFQDADSTLERAALSLVVLVWPSLAALAVRDRWVSSTLLIAGVIVASMAAWTSIALVALAFGALVFAMATLSPRRVGIAAGVLVAVLVLCAPALPLIFDPVVAGLADVIGDRLPAITEASRSLHVWADLMISDKARLITGHGLDMATRARASGFLPSDTPRSILFEIWYELGIVGAIAFAALLAGSLIAAGRTSAIVAPFLLAELATGLTITIWGLDTTKVWWINIVAVAGIAFAIVIRGQYRTDRPSAVVAPTAFAGGSSTPERASSA